MLCSATIFAAAMSAAAYAVTVVQGAAVWPSSSTFSGVAAEEPSNSVHHSTTRIDGDVVFAVASGAVSIGEGLARSVMIARIGSAA